MNIGEGISELVLQEANDFNIPTFQIFMNALHRKDKNWIMLAVELEFYLNMIKIILIKETGFYRHIKLKRDLELGGLFPDNKL